MIRYLDNYDCPRDNFKQNIDDFVINFDMGQTRTALNDAISGKKYNFFSSLSNDAVYRIMKHKSK